MIAVLFHRSSAPEGGIEHRLYWAIVDAVKAGWSEGEIDEVIVEALDEAANDA